MNKALDSSQSDGKSNQGNQSRGFRVGAAILLIALLFILGAWGIPYGLANHEHGQGLQALDDRNFPKAKARFEAAQQWHSLHGRCSLSLARIARLQADAPGARELIEQAYLEGADMALTAREKLLLRVQSAGASRFAKQQDRLLKSHPEDATAVWQAYAIGHMTAQNDVATKAFLQRWESAQPDSAIAKATLATFYFELGEWELAEEYYRSATELNPNLPQAWTGLGQTYDATDQKRESLRCYREATRLDHSNTVAHLRLGKLLLEIGKADESMEHFESVLEQQPRNFSARLEIASFDLEEQRPAKAIEGVMPIINEFPDDVALNYVLATGHSDLGNQSEAQVYLDRHLQARENLERLNLFERKLTTGNPTPTECKELGLGYLKYQWELADWWLQQAFAMNPLDLSVAEALLDVATKSGDPIAIRRYSEAVVLLRGGSL